MYQWLYGFIFFRCDSGWGEKDSAVSKVQMSSGLVGLNRLGSAGSGLEAQPSTSLVARYHLGSK